MTLAIQAVLCTVIPVAMIAAGFRIKKNSIIYMAKGLAYKSKSARRNRDTWRHGNVLFTHMLISVGFNVGVISALFVVMAVKLSDISSWMLTGFVVGFQIITAFLPIIMTEYMLGKTFDDDGNYREDAGDGSGFRLFGRSGKK